jgi:hypothetical protein
MVLICSSVGGISYIGLSIIWPTRRSINPQACVFGMCYSLILSTYTLTL